MPGAKSLHRPLPMRSSLQSVSTLSGGLAGFFMPASVAQAGQPIDSTCRLCW